MEGSCSTVTRRRRRPGAPILILMALSCLVAARPASAQLTSLPDLTRRGVPSGTATASVVSLTMSDAISRGLEHNLAIIAADSRVGDAEGTRLRSLASLLPHVDGVVRQSSQILNVAAFGFTGFSGIPNLIGPFGVFDARLAVTTPLVDIAGMRELQSSRAGLDAERLTRDGTRETVVLVIGSLYLDAVADRARVEAASAQVRTARVLLQAAEDQRAAGVAAGIDVLRQQTQLQTASSREIDATNAFEQAKLRLARAIGLPPEQRFDLASRPAYVAAEAIDAEQASTIALDARPDIRAAEARLASARAERGAATASHLPSLHLDGDYGRLGSETSTAE